MNKFMVGGGIIFLIVLIILAVLFFKQPFKNTLSGSVIDNEPPRIISDLKESPLQKPDVKEEVGLGMVYPQGAGATMSKEDSEAFTSSNPKVLLTDYSIPEAYGESSFTDRDGVLGANEGARVIKLKTTGSQSNFKPFDETQNVLYSVAYSQKNEEVQNGKTLLNENEYINYSDSFVPESALGIQTSPGQMSSMNNCESMYPNVQKYKNFCITDGDIPYGQVVNGKVNPRLVDRWESYTGNYSKEQALKETNGLLYPTLNANFGTI